MKLFSIKFKVRVIHFISGKYSIEWTNHRIFPSWHPLCFWYALGHPHKGACWSIDLWSYQDAEKIAQGLKSIQDVSDYYKPMELEKAQWEKEEKEWWANNAPYKIKKIS